VLLAGWLSGLSWRQASSGMRTWESVRLALSAFALNYVLMLRFNLDIQNPENFSHYGEYWVSKKQHLDA
jgi:hypothetical protein